MRSDGTGIRPLRRGGVAAGVSSGLSWSPNGRRIAFSDGLRMWVMDADGTHVVCVDRTEGGRLGPGPPAWSPTGRWIAYSASRRNPATNTWERDIWVVRTDGSEVRRLLKTPHVDYDVAWSPSGRRVAVTEVWTGELYVMNVDGTHPRALTPGFAALSPEWSPDGRTIVVEHALPNTSAMEWEIWVVDVRNGRRHRLSPVSYEPARHPTWSPDGRMVAFVRGDSGWGDGINVGARPRSAAEIYVMNADGAGLTRLTRNRLGEAFPAWQPTGAPRDPGGG